ncbi:hypothetical protein NDU88_008930 [Pleurodeles waltl]|uniref:Uncharacterized protein n=1 Tax=Pleurodeles waltl TaxID=8319 RepID=A0AAV7NY16_PLEWA|nr:hypothetical protein NDU88_008930 [Pleurodeles waltl]
MKLLCCFGQYFRVRRALQRVSWQPIAIGDTVVKYPINRTSMLAIAACKVQKTRRAADAPVAKQPRPPTMATNDRTPHIGERAHPLSASLSTLRSWAKEITGNTDKSTSKMPDVSTPVIPIRKHPPLGTAVLCKLPQGKLALPCFNGLGACAVPPTGEPQYLLGGQYWSRGITEVSAA